VNQHATIEEAAFSLWAAPRLYNEDLPQLELELSSVVGSCSRGLRRNDKEGIRLCKEDFIVCYGFNESVAQKRIVKTVID
jgi:hypothetical protein